MKAAHLILSMACLLLAGGKALAREVVTDPVKDYLARSSTAPAHRAEQTFFSDDRVYKYQLDLDGDGRQEVLVSSTRERDGKQGFEFYVYQPSGTGYAFAGNMYLPIEGFYVGKVAEAHSFGAVTFFPSGGQEGGYAMYTLKGGKVVDKPLGTRARDPQSLELKGPNLDAKYFGSNANIRESMAVILKAGELKARYGARVNTTKTYIQFVEEELQKRRAQRAAGKNKAPAPPSSAKGLVADPEQDYVSTPEAVRAELGILPKDDLLRLDLDLDGSGRKAVFLACKGVGSKGGPIWTAYLPAAGGQYERVDGIQFRTDFVQAGKIPDYNPSGGLVALFPGKGGGTLVRYRFASGRFSMEEIGQLDSSVAKDCQVFETVFHRPWDAPTPQADPAGLSPRVVPVSKVLERKSTVKPAP